MDVRKFSKRMIELMPLCIRGFSRHECNYLSSGKITMPQFWVLEYLSRQGGGLMSDLADFLNISRPAATGLINRLIVQGLVSRENVERDRREVRVSITTKGKKIVSNIWEQKRNTLIRVFSKLSARDRAQHLTILERVVNILSQTPVPKNKPNAKSFNKRLNILLIAGTIFLSLGPIKTSSAAQSLTLEQCYQLALKQSETIATQQQLLKETEGRFVQALSGILPSISFAYSDERQDTKGAPSSTMRRIPEAKFVFSQPLFSGFKEFAAMSGSRAEFRQRAQEKIRAEQLLFTDVSDAFYNLLLQQEDRATLDTTRAALIERVDELHKREHLGRSRPSEIANAESRLSKVEADLEAILGEEDVARELLEFLTGQKIEDIVDPNEAAIFTDKEHYIEKMPQRPDVKAAQQIWIVAEKQVTVARAGYWPTASLDGNYYTKRVGASEGIDWDVTLNVNAPIFDGALTIGKVKEAKAKAEEARLNFLQTKRSAILDIQNSYSRMAAVIKQRAALEKSLSAAQKNYDLQKEDYTHNLVNNLDVLQALEDLENARRDFIAAKYRLKQQYWKLQLSIGNIPDDAI